MTLLKENLSRLRVVILNFGVTPTDSEDLRLSKVLLTTSVLFSSLPFLLLWSPLFFLSHEPVMASVGIGHSVLTLLTLVIFGQRPQYFRPILIGLNLEGALIIGVISYLAGGFFNSGGLVMWLLMPITGAIIQIGPRYAFALFLIFLGELGLIVLWPPAWQGTTHLPFWLRLVLLFNNLSGVSAFVFFIVAYFVRQRTLALELLRGEQAKSENLLLNILPPEIAARLKVGNHLIADRYEGVSVLFADVVNFTPLSATLTPTALVEMLNEVFSYFDLLAERYAVEKIKTIGDCYMVASGVPRPRADHAIALAAMALEMQTYVSQHEFTGQKLAFRIGINSGPVVAGVIGRKKFIYDLWGDAVNTASRMEAHGVGGLIQITQATYELIKTEFICEPRGVINVKGKGEMSVWQIISKN